MGRLRKVGGSGYRPMGDFWLSSIVRKSFPVTLPAVNVRKDASFEQWSGESSLSSRLLARVIAGEAVPRSIRERWPARVADSGLFRDRSVGIPQGVLPGGGPEVVFQDVVAARRLHRECTRGCSASTTRKGGECRRGSQGVAVPERLSQDVRSGVRLQGLFPGRLPSG